MHNIEYYSFVEKINRYWAQQKLDGYVKQQTYQEGGHGLDKPIRWLESEPICEDEDTAREVIRKRDNGWYDQLAVRYYDPEPIQSKPLTILREKIKTACDEYYARNGKIWAETVTAEFVGCKKCGSRLCRMFLKTNRCPVCGNDLRPETMQKSIATAKAKWEKAQAAEREYIKRNSKKKVMWLVKIEYHT